MPLLVSSWDSSGDPPLDKSEKRLETTLATGRFEFAIPFDSVLGYRNDLELLPARVNRWGIKLVMSKEERLLLNKVLSGES